MKDPASFFSHMDSQLSQHHLLKRLFLPYWIVMALLSKINCINYLSIYLPTYLSISSYLLISVPHCFDYCTFVVSFEVRKFEPSNFVLLFQDCVSYWEPLQFFMSFRISFSIFAKKCCWDFDRNCTESVGQFAEYCHLKNIKSSHPWMWDVFPFTSSLIWCSNVLYCSVYKSCTQLNLLLGILLFWFCYKWNCFPVPFQ